ncbi:MAG: hypothetical protein ACRER5_16175 [Pseudomonas sp.]
MQPHYTKTVTVAGVTYTVLSRFERLAMVGGRYFAALGSHARGYTLYEHDDDLTNKGSCRVIGRRPERIMGTPALSDEILRLAHCGERLPPDDRHQTGAGDQLAPSSADVSLKACSIRA